MSRNYLTSLVFAILFLVVANVRADMVNFTWNPAKTGASDNTNWMAGKFTLTAEDVDTGIYFKFQNTFDGGGLTSAGEFVPPP